MKKLTQMKTLTSVLLMIVIQIVIWMYYAMTRPKHERLTVAMPIPAGLTEKRSQTTENTTLTIQTGITNASSVRRSNFINRPNR